LNLYQGAGAYIGFTAATGDNYMQQVIEQWSFESYFYLGTPIFNPGISQSLYNYI
jgi:hypothetical protein